MRRALLVICVMLLAACRVDATVDIVMGVDGSGHITVTAIADADVVSKAPGLAADLRFDDVKAAGWTVTEPAATNDGHSPQPSTAMKLAIIGWPARIGRAVKVTCDVPDAGV